MLTTVQEVIEALGGTHAAAELIGVGDPAISNWKTWGKIPSSNFKIITEALAWQDLKIDPRVFGFRSAVRRRRAR